MGKSSVSEENGVHGLAGGLLSVVQSRTGSSSIQTSGRFNGEIQLASINLAPAGGCSLLQEFINEQSDLKGFTGGNQLTLSPTKTRLYVSGHSARWRVFRRDAATGKLDYLGDDLAMNRRALAAMLRPMALRVARRTVPLLGTSETLGQFRCLSGRRRHSRERHPGCRERPLCRSERAPISVGTATGGIPTDVSAGLRTCLHINLASASRRWTWDDHGDWPRKSRPPAPATRETRRSELRSLNDISSHAAAGGRREGFLRTAWPAKNCTSSSGQHRRSPAQQDQQRW